MNIKQVLDIMQCTDEAERNRMIGKLGPSDAKEVLRYVLAQMHGDVGKPDSRVK